MMYNKSQVYSLQVRTDVHAVHVMYSECKQGTPSKRQAGAANALTCVHRPQSIFGGHQTTQQTCYIQHNVRTLCVVMNILSRRTARQRKGASMRERASQPRSRAAGTPLVERGVDLLGGHVVEDTGDALTRWQRHLLPLRELVPLIQRSFAHL